MTEVAMSDPVAPLILDLLEWIGPRPRPYAEVLEAWRTSCPRLPVWEEANKRGFIEQFHEPGHAALVAVSALGRKHLDQRRARPPQVAERLASCSCGQLRAEVASEPIRVSVCHCLACQRRTGSVFGAQARFPKACVTITGASKEFVRIGDAGTSATFSFCPACGATVHYALSGHDDVIAIPVGAFADPSFPAPGFSVYEGRKHSWVHIPGEVTHTA
jgi:hypothetical protein